MRRIFFEEKLGETRRNSEGGASRTGRDGVGAARAGMDFWGKSSEVLEGGNGGSSENN